VSRDGGGRGARRAGSPIESDRKIARPVAADLDVQDTAAVRQLIGNRPGPHFVAVQRELKRRTVKLRVFPGEDALERLVCAIRVAIDEKWACDTRAFIKSERQDA